MAVSAHDTISDLLREVVRHGDDPDAELIARARNGDRTALGMLVSNHEQRIYNLALRLTGNKHDAEDALQETFLTLVAKLDSFSGQARLSTWLYRVAINASLRVGAKRGREAPALSADESEARAPESASPDTAVLTAESRSTLDAAVADLPENLRTVLVLRDVQAFSTKETAEVLEISEQAVKNRLHRARLELRQTLSPYFKGLGREEKHDELR